MFAFPIPVKKLASGPALPARRRSVIAGALGAGIAGTGGAAAHVSEMGLVLLMPTDLYIQTGVWVVALTVLALAVVPAKWIEAAFRPVWSWPARGREQRHDQEQEGGQERGPWLLSIASALLLLGLIWSGLNGSRDPLVNPLPLMVWTVIWIALLIAQSLIGDLWRLVNPWTGPARMLGGGRAPFRLPERLGTWPGAVGLMAFACFALADPAPDDPARLALFTGGYWLVMLAACLLWGAETVLARCEFLSMTATRFALLAPVIWHRKGTSLGLPGWQVLRIQTGSAVSLSGGVFALLVLGVGSFDGLNETFWWLGQIGVNPLEFPGRSALIGVTVAGLAGTCAALVAVFVAALKLGLLLAPGIRMRRAFGPMALSVLPIGLAYHFAHYLTTLLVNGQYAIAALSDPLGTGADLLGLGRYYVTTSFFNTPDGVQMIFTAQAGAVIAGHVLSVIIAHAIATRLYGDARRAAISQIPLAVFMIGYTFLGLWLLASPKGA